jgi:hypothetical protein
MWAELIHRFTKNIVLFPPAESAEIDWLEEHLETNLPDSLRSFLLETNGLGLRPAFVEWEVPDDFIAFIFSSDEMMDVNTNVRATLSQKGAPSPQAGAASFLFFASEPNGDYIGLPVEDGRVLDVNVTRVSHENWAVRDELPDSFEQFLVRYLMAIQQEEERIVI